MIQQNAWGSFWQAGTHQAAYSANSTPEGTLRTHWQGTFASLALQPGDRVLDIAAGSGIVSRLAMEHLPNAQHLQFYGLDVAASGAAGYAAACPQAHALVADAASLPIRDNSISLVVSQFGLEYAAKTAPLEAARILKPGGSLRLAMHHQEGGLYRECAANLTALSVLSQSGLFVFTREIFESTPRDRGGSNRMQHLAKFNAASGVVADHLSRAGHHIAGGALLRMLQDCSHMVARAQSFDPGEVLAWIRHSEAEASQYAQRMSLMCDAALDRPAAESLQATLRGAGMQLEPLRTLMMGTANPLPGAWIIQGTKLR